MVTYVIIQSKIEFSSWDCIYTSQRDLCSWCGQRYHPSDFRSKRIVFILLYIYFYRFFMQYFVLFSSNQCWLIYDSKCFKHINIKFTKNVVLISYPIKVTFIFQQHMYLKICELQLTLRYSCYQIILITLPFNYSLIFN